MGEGKLIVPPGVLGYDQHPTIPLSAPRNTVGTVEWLMTTVSSSRFSNLHILQFTLLWSKHPNLLIKYHLQARCRMKRDRRTTFLRQPFLLVLTEVWLLSHQSLRINGHLFLFYIIIWRCFCLTAYRSVRFQMVWTAQDIWAPVCLAQPWSRQRLLNELNGKLTDVHAVLKSCRGVNKCELLQVWGRKSCFLFLPST